MKWMFRHGPRLLYAASAVAITLLSLAIASDALGAPVVPMSVSTRLPVGHMPPRQEPASRVHANARHHANVCLT